jgi:hypothetical protein
VTDLQFTHALETCTLPEAEFGHAAHVRAAYLYLLSADFAGALQRMGRAIRAYAASLGKPDRYHQTITIAYLALIHQHMVERGDGGGWENFERQNPELFDPNLLLHFYTRSELESPLARRLFLLPRRQGAADGPITAAG